MSPQEARLAKPCSPDQHRINTFPITEDSVMPVADRDEGPHKAAPLRRRVPPAGHSGPGDDRPAPRRPAPSMQARTYSQAARRRRGRRPRFPARRSLPPGHAQALRSCRARRHRRAHRHEPRPADRRHRPPPDRARRGRPRLRHPGSAARRLRLPAQSGPQLPGLARKTSTSRPARFAARPADRPGRRGADPPADRGPGQLRPDAGRAGQRRARRTRRRTSPTSRT